MKERPLELETSGTVLNPTELARYNMNAQAGEHVARKRGRTPSGIVEKGEAEPIGTRLARVFVADYQMGSHETDATLHRLVDQAKEDYLRLQTHPELEIVTDPAFFEKAVNLVRGNLVKLAGTREQPLDPSRVYLNIQKAFDEALRRAIMQREQN